MRLFYPALRNSQGYFGVRAVIAKYGIVLCRLGRDSTDPIIDLTPSAGWMWQVRTRKHVRLPAMVMPGILFHERILFVTVFIDATADLSEVGEQKMAA